jgi:hypothetical protein
MGPSSQLHIPHAHSARAPRPEVASLRNGVLTTKFIKALTKARIWRQNE